jgi:UDP-2,3-diacylglucosamine hydrolase
MANTYFMSDAHLGADSPNLERNKEEKLLQFFKHVSENGERLFIVGDLFDFWFEYRTVIRKGFTRILCGLKHLQERGIELHYVAGNHDFWMRGYLASEFGFQIHFDEVEWSFAKKHFYIFHGDGLAHDDGGYRLLKRVFRNRVNIFLYSLLHPDLGIPFAKWMSSVSRRHTSRDAPPPDDDYISRAVQKFDEGFDYAIFGHLHSPRYKKFGKKIYVNLGDWIENFSYAKFDGKILQLLNWK